tara:strand:- start:156 stop:284 length:129 start_codon:yes stop_codon:yes gene_type:complete
MNNTKELEINNTRANITLIECNNLNLDSIPMSLALFVLGIKK